MAYVMSGKKRAAVQALVDAGPDTHMQDSETSLSRYSLARICDHRLRAIRIWLHDGEQVTDKRCVFLIKDLKFKISMAKSLNHIDADWLEKLEDLISKIDVTDLVPSFTRVYDHLEKPFPRGILGFPSDSVSRDARRSSADPTIPIRYVERHHR